MKMSLGSSMITDNFLLVSIARNYVLLKLRLLVMVVNIICNAINKFGYAFERLFFTM